MSEIAKYYQDFEPNAKEICSILAIRISEVLEESEAKIWHGHPVWFIDGNPIVGFSLLKSGGVKLMFWSGQSFDESKLTERSKKFKDAAIIYTDPSQIDIVELYGWLQKSREIQWDYKNIVKHKGELRRIG